MRHESRLLLIDCETDGLWAGKETHGVCFSSYNIFQVQAHFFLVITAVLKHLFASMVLL